MAIYNEILAARFPRLLQKIFSMKGQSAVPALAGEIMPVIALWNGVENRVLEGWNRFGVFTGIGPAAGFKSAVRLGNIKASKAIAVIEKLQFMAGAAGQVNLELNTNPGDAALTNAFGTLARLDARVPYTSSMRLSNGADASSVSIGNVMSGVNFLSATPVPYDQIATDNQELTVLPGDALQIITSGNNLAINVGMVWRERVLEDSELFA